MLHYAYILHNHISYILLTLFVLENIDMPLVKDNALVTAASEKYKIKQFKKTLNKCTMRICTNTSPQETQT